MGRFFVRVAGRITNQDGRPAVRLGAVMHHYTLEELRYESLDSEQEELAVLAWAEGAPAGSWISVQLAEKQSEALWFCLRDPLPNSQSPVTIEEDELLIAADRLEELGFDGAAAALRKLIDPPQRFYLLQIHNGVFGPVSLWDRCVRAVVLATSEQHARRILHDDANNETSAIWLDPERSSCVALSADSKPGVVLRDTLAS